MNQHFTLILVDPDGFSKSLQWSGYPPREIRVPKRKTFNGFEPFFRNVTVQDEPTTNRTFRFKEEVTSTTFLYEELV